MPGGHRGHWCTPSGAHMGLSVGPLLSGPEEPGRYLAIARGIVGAGTWGGGQHSAWSRDGEGQNELPLLSGCPEAPRSWPPYSSCLSAPPASLL